MINALTRGIHHLALAVPDEVALVTLFEKPRVWPEVGIEREPGFIRGDTGARHFSCVMPGGTRVEFAAPFA